MDQKERSADIIGGLKVALAGWQRGIWTAMPGIVDSYNEPDNTVEVVLAIKATIVAVDPKTGAQTPAEVPITKLVKVPLHQIGNPRFVVDIRPAPGDEVTVIFASRCIDGWWQSGGVQGQIEQRAHDLSDGIAIPGLFSAPTAQAAGLGAGGLRIRDIAGGASMVMPGDGSLTINAPAGLAINADITTTGTIVNNGHHVDSTHKHKDTQPGGGLSGVPN